MSKVLRLSWHGPQVKKAERGAAARGLTAATEHLLGRSRDIVPIETGALSRSGRAEVDPTQLVGAVSYDTPYARRQHEELTWRHDAGRSAKYLEKPLHSERQTMLALIESAIRGGLR